MYRMHFDSKQCRGTNIFVSRIQNRAPQDTFPIQNEFGQFMNNNVIVLIKMFGIDDKKKPLMIS